MILLLTLPTLAEPYVGEFLSVKIENAPPETTQAHILLDRETALPLTKGASGAWTGTFLILPGLYSGLPDPTTVLRDAQDRILSTDGVNRHLASSTLKSEDLPSALGTRGMRVVFDSRVQPDTLKLLTWIGGEYTPNLGTDTFTLPTGLDPDSVAGIKARSTAGDIMVFQAGWDIDLAELE